MFVDASAIIAIIAGESDRLSLSARLAQSSEVYVSPIVVYEATTGLARLRACSMHDAEKLVSGFIDETHAGMIDITLGIARDAANAFARSVAANTRPNLTWAIASLTPARASATCRCSSKATILSIRISRWLEPV